MKTIGMLHYHLAGVAALECKLLHALLQVVHRDLKLENILLSKFPCFSDVALHTRTVACHIAEE